MQSRRDAHCQRTQAAMVTSTSTPASMLTMICLTTSVGALRLYGFPCQSSVLHAVEKHPGFARGETRKMVNVLDEALVDAHLVEIPGLGTLTARGLTGGDLEVLGGQADRALDGQVLALGALDQLGADLLEGLDLAGGQGDADLVGLLYDDNKGIEALAILSSPATARWCWRGLSSTTTRIGSGRVGLATHGSLKVSSLLGLLVRHLDG